MGIVVEPETAAFGRFLDKWLETAVKPRVRAKTLEDCRKLLARYARLIGAHRECADCGSAADGRRLHL